MTTNLSVYTKIAAFIFLIGGLLNLGLSLISITAMFKDPEGLRQLVGNIVNWTILIVAILEIVSGIYMIKQKRWAYYLGFILVVLSLLANLLILIKFGTFRYYGVILGIVILIFLILGKKDFSKKVA